MQDQWLGDGLFVQHYEPPRLNTLLLDDRRRPRDHFSLHWYIRYQQFAIRLDSRAKNEGTLCYLHLVLLEKNRCRFRCLGREDPSLSSPRRPPQNLQESYGKLIV